MSLFAATLLMLAGGTGQRVIDNWMVYDGADKNREWIVFIERSALFQRPDGWVNFSYFEVMNGSQLKSVKSTNMAAWANCKTREFVNDYRMAYGVDGKLLLQEKINEPRRVVRSGSIEERILAFACGDTRTAVQMPRGVNLVVAANELYGRGRQSTARAPTARVPAAPPSKPPARATEFWLVMATENGDFTVFVDRASIAERGDGKIFVAIDTVDREADDPRWFKARILLDCARRRSRDLEVDVYRLDGTYGGRLPDHPERAVTPGSYMEDVLAFVCRGNRQNTLKLEPGQTTLEASTLVQRNLSARNPSSPKQ